MTTPAAAEPASRRYLARQRRATRVSAVAAVVLAAVLLPLWELAQTRAERLRATGVPAVAQVVEHDVRGKSGFVVLRLSASTGELLDVAVRVDGGHDVARYPIGSTVRVWHDPANPADLRTAEHWNTPGRVLGPGIVALVGCVTATTCAVGLGRWSTRLERRLRTGPWVSVPVELVRTPDGGSGAAFPAPSGERVDLPPVLWPFPGRVDVLREPPAPTVLVRVPPRPGQDLGTVLELPRRPAAGRARSPRARRRRPTA